MTRMRRNEPTYDAVLTIPVPVSPIGMLEGGGWGCLFRLLNRMVAWLLALDNHPDFASKARMLGGAWDRERSLWVFDASETDRVRTLCREIYGTDRTEPFPNPEGIGSNSRQFAEARAPSGATSVSPSATDASGPTFRT